MHMKSLTFAIAIAGTLLAIVSTPLGIAADNTLRIPAFTAYLEPDDGGARISSKSGVTSWKDASTKVLWFGELKKPGELNAAVELRLPQDANSKLRLTVAGQSRDAVVKGAGTNTVTARFGNFTVAKPGYQKFTLESLNASGQSFGDIDALVLDGVTTYNTHFNYKSRRNAASVHLGYPVPKGTNVAAFYCEMTGLEDPVHTYYMACGWHRGYFGMQVNSTTERRIIFSVWDSGGEGVDRKKVEDDNRVKLMSKGENVYTGDFGNEGTGGHSHLKFQWKTGEKQRFVVTALVTFFVIRLRSLPGRVLVVADAFALALFTMIGVRKGVTLEFASSVAIMLGIITGVAGGILRDVLIGEVPLVFRREIHLYATAALGGAVLYIGLHAIGVREIVATTAGMILTLALRLAGIRWKLGLPLLEAR